MDNVENNVENVATPTDEKTTEEEETVKAGQNAIEFLQNITQDNLELCLFDDALVTTSDDGQTIGEFTVSVKKVKKEGKDMVLVHAASQGKIENTPMGTSITAYLNPNDLSLGHQEHMEYVKVPGHELEKVTEMTMDQEAEQLVVRRKVIRGQTVKKSVYKFPKEKVNGFITEGINLVLQRLLIKSNFRDESLTFITLDSDSGHIVPTLYKALPERQQQVGKHEITVYGIERRMVSVTDLPYTWQSYFMMDGHLTMRVQIGSPAISVIEKVPRLIEHEVMEPKPVFGKKQLIWEEDMEMESRFLQRKDELKAGHHMYLRDHPEASALLADFFQFLLLRRPDDVVGFAADFFSNFSNSFPETSPYKHSDTSVSMPFSTS